MGLIGPAHRLASWFLLSGVLFAAAYALPLLLAPMAWARFFRWPIPDEAMLCVYLGRCVGGLALAIIVIVLRAVPDPAGNLPRAILPSFPDLERTKMACRFIVMAKPLS